MVTEDQAIEWNISYLKEFRRKLRKDTSPESRQEVDSMIQYWMRRRRKFGQPKAPGLENEFARKGPLSKQPRASRKEGHR